MASGYVGETTNSFSLRIRWWSTYDAATNTSTITIVPQEKDSGSFGGSMLGVSRQSGDGVYLDGTLIYSLDSSYGSSSRNLSGASSNAWKDFTPTVGSYANTITVPHDNSGKASITTRVSCTIFPYNFPSESSYWHHLDTGSVTISLSESRSLHVSYNANGGSGAPGNTYFYGSTESIKLSSTIPTREGYTFLGWDTSASATTATYSAGQNIGTRTSSLTLYAVWRKNTYTLSISAGAGSSIEVKRGSTTLSNGDTVTYGDELAITFSASEGYNLGAHTVNGIDFTSGGSHTVTGAVSVVSTAALKTFALTIMAEANSSILVERGGTTLANGDTITYGDEVTITFSTPPAYELSMHTVNGADFTSGGSHTVTGAVTVTSAAALKIFALSISAGRGSSIRVKRGGTTLSDGDTITYGDELTITFSASEGYDLDAHTVNGSVFSSGGSHIVTGAVSVVSTATLKTFALSISAGRGTSILVMRGGTTLTDGATITYGDVIEISVAATAGYLLREVELNGGALVSPVVVSTNISIEATAIPAGAIIAGSASNDTYQIVIDTGSAYEVFIPYMDNGQSWELF